MLETPFLNGLTVGSHIFYAVCKHIRYLHEAQQLNVSKLKVLFSLFGALYVTFEHGSNLFMTVY